MYSRIVPELSSAGGASATALSSCLLDELMRNF